jgi:hypothetical protein
LVSLAANNLPPPRGIWKSLTHFIKEINIDQIISYSLKLLHKSQSNGLLKKKFPKSSNHVICLSGVCASSLT